MRSPHSGRSLAHLILILTLALFATTPAPAQARRTHAASQATPLVVTGQVQDLAGRPAPAVLVWSSAGGQTQTLADGSFELRVTPQPRDRQLRVSALLGSGASASSASVLVQVNRAASGTWTGLLTLQAGGSCAGSWLPSFGGGPGIGSSTISGESVLALAVFDDGTGPALFAGGDFTIAGGKRANHIIKWDGARWSTLGEGLTGLGNPTTQVQALLVHDDGTGAQLYVAGDFNLAGGSPADDIARWDGTSWSPVGTGIGGGAPLSSVRTLVSFDAGSGAGAQLFAGGQFTQNSGPLPAHHLVRWDGTSWSGVGESATLTWSPGAELRALRVHDDGTGPALYAAGSFDGAPGVVARDIARWNGSAWSALGLGVTGGEIYALQVFDDGTGEALYAGGTLTQAGGSPASYITRWDGSTWSTFGAPLDQFVFSLEVYDDGLGAGPALFAGGSFADAGGSPLSNIGRWDGIQWSAVDQGVSGGAARVLALAVFDDGNGPDLIAAGRSFTQAGTVQIERMASWNGSGWNALGSGLSHHVQALAGHDDGSGPALYAGGTFKRAGGVPVNQVARWDPSGWSALGSGMNGPVLTLAELDLGGTPALFAGGVFTTADGLPAQGIARWTGSTWARLGGGVQGGFLASVQAITLFDDGSGPALVAGGNFTAAGGIPASRLARWDGQSWSALGGGVDSAVLALQVFDDGRGPALYAGGFFSTAGGVPARNVACWDGTSWSPLGAGLGDAFTGQVDDFAVFDDGSGPALYAGGNFFNSGATTGLQHIARWDGTSWTSVGAGVAGPLRALHVFDDGDGARLYAGGAGGLGIGQTPFGIFDRWDGSAWTPVAAGVSEDVFVFAEFDDGVGSGPALVLGGKFTSAPGAGDSYIARWGGCGGSPTYCTPGTSSDGCRATLTSAGAASASASSGFTLTAWNSNGGRPGLFFFGSNGRQALPWGNGTSFQCVVPPVQRGTLLAGSGNPGSCDGLLSQDLNALWCSTCPKPTKNPGVGTLVQAQLWYRDPGSTSNQTTSLSDALEFTVGP